MTQRDTIGPEARIYHSKVTGRFWIEATAGPSKVNINKFKNLAPGIVAEFDIPSIVRQGPVYGVAAGARFGFFTLGARFDNADYDLGSIKTLGLDLGFLIRVPHVHPYVRMTFSYAWANDQGIGKAIIGDVFPGFENVFRIDKIRGGAATIGAGIRIPVIRYLSIAMGVDVTAIGLKFTGEWDRVFFADTCDFDPKQCDLKSGTGGLATKGMFALTFHY